MDPENKLIAAARPGDLATLKTLLAEGANANDADELGWTALHWSAGRGDVEAVRLLLEHHADVTITGRDRRTPLMVARSAGRQAVAAILTDAEKAKGVWTDPGENKPYCKAFYLKQFAGYPQWSPTTGGQASGKESTGNGDAIVYLHQDFTVTKSVWPGESVIFDAVNGDWIRFCESELKFSVPADLV